MSLSPLRKKSSLDRCCFKSIVVLVAVVVSSALVSCTTVKTTIDPLRSISDGIESAQQLSGTRAEVGEGAHSTCGAHCLILLEEAERFENHGQTVDAAACYLRAAVLTHNALADPSETNPKEIAAVIDLHNRSLARFAEIWSVDDRRNQPGPHQFTSHGEQFEIALSAASDFAADYFDRAVAAASLRSKGVAKRTRDGVGASLVGIRENRPERAEEMQFYWESGVQLPVTMVIDHLDPVAAPTSDRTRVTLSLVDPFRRQSTRINGTRYPLAANFSAPVELVLDGYSELRRGLGGFFSADKRIEQSGIFLAEPYDPERIPVVLTHGLASDPIIWRNLFTELMAEPDIARRYQLMAFTYPSAYTIIESNFLFRQQLAALRAKYDPQAQHPLSTNMVAVGHSMGGVLTHFLVADFDDALWNQISDVPLDDLPLTPEMAASARERLFFEPDPGIRRAIFMSTPHGGASMANASFAGWLSRLANLPTELVAATTEVLDPRVVESLKIEHGKMITSVQSLKPDSPEVLALAEAPYKPGVIYHSIIGDRGKGDSPDSSDGAVEYSSSHQAGAASELIVASGHRSYKNPEAIAELKRILRLHAGPN